MSIKIKILIISFISSICGFVIGSLVCNKTSEIFYESHDQTNQKYISPLLACGNPPSVQLNDLKKEIINFIDTNNNSSHVSVYFRDLNNGPWFGIDEDELFSPASLAKVPIMIAYFKLSETDPSVLQKKILNNLPDYTHDQSISPEVSISPNQEYTVDDLIKYMIIYSDNNSYELLQANLDNQVLKNTFTDLGIDISPAQNNSGGNIISVKSYASFFRILFNASYLNPSLSSKALTLLTQTRFNKGLVAGVGQGIDIAHKFGERIYNETEEKQLHDCGIVYLPNQPYLICIMTRGNDFNQLSLTIKAISKIVYDHIKNK